jgi:hypothetical protein
MSLPGPAAAAPPEALCCRGDRAAGRHAGPGTLRRPVDAAGGLPPRRVGPVDHRAARCASRCCATPSTRSPPVTTWRCAPGAASLRPSPERQPHPPCPLKAHRESGTLVESARSQGQLLTPADPSLTLTWTQRVTTSGKPEKKIPYIKGICKPLQRPATSDRSLVEQVSGSRPLVGSSFYGHLKEKRWMPRQDLVASLAPLQ